jgi:hypothetical protein
MAGTGSNESARITLPDGRYALCDREDFNYLSRFRWALGSPASGQMYPVTQIGNTKIPMHRMVIGHVGKLNEVDHINRDGFDNRKCNLRVCSRSQNLRNRDAKKGRSRFKGVWPTDSGRWRAHIKVEGKRISLGTFEREEQAAAAYDSAAEKYHGKFAATNHKLGRV